MKVLNDDKTLALSYRTESTKEQSRGMRLTESDVGTVVEGLGTLVRCWVTVHIKTISFNTTINLWPEY